MSQTIVVTGGGSGGHITPILAVAAELKRQRPDVRIVYITPRGDKFANIPAEDANIDEVRSVWAGKFRRYHGEGWRQLLDVTTSLKNIRDAVYVLLGIIQSYRLMRELRPAVVFSRGAFVSVPVCLGAALRRVPYITHDSDLVPSLANRLIAPWARWHAVALAAELYPYPATKTVTTGIPLSKEFVQVTPRLQVHYRQELGLPTVGSLLLIIGGGLGSERINRAVAEALPPLLQDFRKLEVVHIVGRDHETDMRQRYDGALPSAERDRLQLRGFVPDVYRYSGAADIIVTRAGATALAEFAQQGKACIVVPAPFLTGGHQLSNAQYLAEQGAAVVVNETDLTADPNRLAKQLARLLREPVRRQQLGAKLSTFARPDATRDLAELILRQL